MANIVTDIFNTLRNAVLNTAGVDRDLEQLLRHGDVPKVRGLMQDRDEEVIDAIREYNPDTHDVMRVQYKLRDGKEPYELERLPRSWQRFINEIAVFFLLGKPIKFQNGVKVTGGAEDPTAEAFTAFEDFLKDMRFHATMQEAKELAGAETESAILFHIYRNDQEFRPEVKALVLAKSKGYTLRPLFDQWDNMLAFGYGYFVKDGSNTIEHFDVQTATTLYNCTKRSVGWQVDIAPNPTGKINVIYCRQPKEWTGVQRRIDRDEKTDSRTADSNNYFARPKLVCQADALASLPDSTKVVGEVIVVNGETGANPVYYLEPPRSSEEYKTEKETLKQSILQDSFTPDFSYENMKGMGTLSGEALRRALILGYIKRDKNIRTYEPLVDRAKNLILSIMTNVTHNSLRAQIEQLKVSASFTEPFSEDANSRMTEIARLYGEGVMSLRTAVSEVGVAGDVEEEIKHIQAEKAAITERDLFGNGVEA